MSKDERVAIKVYFPESELEALKKRAIDEDRSMSTLIKRIILADQKRYKRRKK